MSLEHSPSKHQKKRHHLDRRATDLIANGSGPDDDLLSTREVADWLGMSILWMEVGRMRGYGPRFVRVGPRRIRYCRADVVTWLRERTYSRTDQYEGQATKSVRA